MTEFNMFKRSRDYFLKHSGLPGLDSHWEFPAPLAHLIQTLELL